MRVVIDLPIPPSTNRLWRSVRTGRGVRLYKDRKYTAWLAEVGWEWQRQKPKGFKTIEGPVRSVLIVCPKRKTRDLGNYEKAVHDAAQHFGVIKDDNNIRHFQCWFGDASEAPAGIRLIIETINPDRA